MLVWWILMHENTHLCTLFLFFSSVPSPQFGSIVVCLSDWFLFIGHCVFVQSGRHLLLEEYIFFLYRMKQYAPVASWMASLHKKLLFTLSFVLFQSEAGKGAPFSSWMELFDKCFLTYHCYGSECGMKESAIHILIGIFLQMSFFPVVFCFVFPWSVAWKGLPVVS